MSSTDTPYSTTDAASVRLMFDRIASRYNLTNHFISLGMYSHWQSRLIATLPEGRQKKALDLCTGTGALIGDLEKRFDDVTAVDFSEEMLKYCRPCHAKVEWGDAHQLKYSDSSFDVVTTAYGVRNFARREQALREICRVLRPGGSLHIQEFGQPKNFLISRVYRFYSRFILPYLGGLLSGDMNAYRYLPSTAHAFPCGDAFANELRAVGLQVDSVVPMCFGVMYLYVAHKPA